MYCIGIDIGSTSSKATIFNEDKLIENILMPTGWSSVNTAIEIKKKIESLNISLDDARIVATGYGRVSVPYAQKTMTEITCHAKGAVYLSKRVYNGSRFTVIDIGGQDTKVITIGDGNVTDFIMNDKCAAGTGRFIELMANTLGVTINGLTRLAETGQGIEITSMCTVFAESEIISLIGRGAKREDIACGIIQSVAKKVKQLCERQGRSDFYFLTGGLCENGYIVDVLAKQLGKKVAAVPDGRFAGSIGAAIIAERL